MIISILKLAIATLIPVAVAAAFAKLEKTEMQKKKSWISGQIKYGIIFGLIAVIGTEWGIQMNGAIVNCRDAAPVIAGLFFGGPAGIIAGIIGGVERWFAVYWGVGAYTRVACSVSTVMAGIIAAFLRKMMFEGKRPTWSMALFSGVLIEVLHLFMVFFTNVDNAEKAINVVRVCTAPMITANGMAVMLTSIVLYLMSSKRKNTGKENKVKSIFETVQNWLFGVILFAFLAVSSFMILLESNLGNAQIEEQLTLAMDEVKQDVTDASDDYHINMPDISNSLKNRHIGKNGFFIVLDEKNNLVASSSNYSAEDTFDVSDLNISLMKENKVRKTELNNTKYYYKYNLVDDYRFIALCSVEDAMTTEHISVYISIFDMIMVFALLFVLVYILIKKLVVNQIVSMAQSLSRISEGNLDEVVNVRNNAEFASLSDDINSTVDTLKRYIDEAASRIDAELEFARNIQLSALPSHFPAFPNRKDFDIYARMDTAKEVGGDFYDFFFTDTDQLNLVIADVSGKGIPAAMFMMRAKSVLRAQSGQEKGIDEVFTESNNTLCAGNDANMFVTTWEGVIDLKNGKMNFANAGHNPPLVKYKGGEFEFLKVRPNLVLGSMEDIHYRKHETSLEPGDIVYLYTDGITEATNAENELYGEKRLLSFLNSREFTDMNDICDSVKADVDAFVGDAPQFDDMTMVAFIYYGPEKNN